MLYIMRHGKTDWNAQFKLQGGTDIPLNEEGREMARKAREKYKDISIDKCFVSPLQRAGETAQIFLEGRDIPVIVDQRLREMSFGDYEGMDHVYKHPDCPVYKLFKDPVNYIAVNHAESFEELYARTGAFIKEVLEPELSQGHDILVVGHGAMNCSIINQIKGTPLERFWEHMHDNCQLLNID